MASRAALAPGLAGAGAEPDDDADAVDFTVWREDTWDAEREAQARARLDAKAVQPAYHKAHFTKHMGKQWNAFYEAREDRFFKNRLYLERDFPLLAAAATAPFSLLELGCGVGDALLPLVAALPHLHVTAFDLSRKACRIIEAHALHRTGRVCVFSHNAISGLGATRAAVAAAHAAFTPPAAVGGGGHAEEQRAGALHAASAPYAPPSAPAAADAPCQPLPPTARFVGFDAALMLFMASALPHEALALALREAALALRPGGALLFRDYAIYDEAELRFGRGRRLGPHLFVRSDGTLAAFFAVPQLVAAAHKAGLEVAECRYLYRRYTNRAQGTELRRVWLHGVFRRPGCDPALGGAPVAACYRVDTPSPSSARAGGASPPQQQQQQQQPPAVEAAAAALVSEYAWLREVCRFVGSGWG